MIENNIMFSSEVAVTNPQGMVLLGNKLLSAITSKDLLS